MFVDNQQIKPNESPFKENGIFYYDISYNINTLSLELKQNPNGIPILFTTGKPSEDCKKISLSSFGIITDGESYILEKRSKSMKVFPGKLGFPGGFVEIKDNVSEDPMESAKREIFEELGVEITGDLQLKCCIISCPNGVFTVMIVYEKILAIGELSSLKFKIDPKEVEEVLVLNKEEIKKIVCGESSNSFTPNIKTYFEKNINK